jgi:replicative DNA helicase
MNAEAVLSLAVDKDAPEYRQAPHNLQAEQALLGAILVNNVALNHINDHLRPEHFYEPVHQRIYGTIQRFHDRGQIANPVTLKHFFDQDQSLAEIGGGEYLAKLAGAAVAVINVTDYSDLIYDLALKRELITIGEEVVNNAYDLAEDEAASMQIERAEQQLFNLSSSGEGSSGFQPFRVSSGEAVERAERAIKRRGDVVGVSTGLTDLNRMLGGMQNSDLLILAGRPSMGKTALSTTIAYNAARRFQHEFEDEVKRGEKHPDRDKPKSVGFFSLEMSAEQLATRILSARAEINSSGILRGDLSNDQFSTLVQASNELAEMPFYIDDTPALSISALRTRARRLKRVSNLGFLVVDYLQLVRPSSSGSQSNRVQEVSEITQGLKAIAKELDIPVMALSQLSRQVEQREDKRPQLSDLRESGSIEQDADVVMFIFREEYYLERKRPHEDDPTYADWQAKMERIFRLAEIIIAKQRNGPIGTVFSQFIPDHTRFTDVAADQKLPEVYE